MLPARTELLLSIPYLIMLTDIDRNEAGMKAVRAVGIDDFVIVPTPDYKDVGDFRYNDAVGCEQWIRSLDNDYSERWHEDPGAAVHRWAFAGDSTNDAACFAAFRTTFGVANVRAFVRRMSMPPRWIASAERGEGFAEIARALLAARA